MKMKLASRVILLLGALLLPVVGVLAVLFAFHTQNIAMDKVPLLSWQRVPPLALGVILILFGVFLLLLPRRMRKHTAPFIAQQTAGGELRISMRAIENIIKKCTASMPDLKLIQMDAAPVRGSVAVDLHLSMPSNVSIPLAAERLQTLIVKQLQATAGVENADVRISVETTEADAAEGLQVQAPLPKIVVPGTEDNAAEEAPTVEMPVDGDEIMLSGDLPANENDAEARDFIEDAAAGEAPADSFEDTDTLIGEQENADERKEL